MSELEKSKNNAYWERNQLVAALSKVLPAFLTKHPEEDKDWEDDWRTIVVVEIRGDFSTDFDGQDQMRDYQLTWHIHDHDIPMFDHLHYLDYVWDGDTTEEKYRRLRSLATDISVRRRSKTNEPS